MIRTCWWRNWKLTVTNIFLNRSCFMKINQAFFKFLVHLLPIMKNSLNHIYSDISISNLSFLNPSPPLSHRLIIVTNITEALIFVQIDCKFQKTWIKLERLTKPFLNVEIKVKAKLYCSTVYLTVHWSKLDWFGTFSLPENHRVLILNLHRFF